MVDVKLLRSRSGEILPVAGIQKQAVVKQDLKAADGGEVDCAAQMLTYCRTRKAPWCAMRDVRQLQRYTVVAGARGPGLSFPVCSVAPAVGRL